MNELKNCSENSMIKGSVLKQGKQRELLKSIFNNSIKNYY